MDKHPAACPHCGGTTVNQAWADMLLAPAYLNPDGYIVVGENDSSADFRGPCLLHCHTCGSTYVQPRDVEERFDDHLKIDYPAADPAAHIGADVVWLALTPGQITELGEALETHEYWDLADLLPKNNGHVWLPGDAKPDRYWDGEPSPEQVEAIVEVKTTRALAELIRAERDRQVPQ